ncbi:four-carbon acid sugar kinase family protein [Paenibacillus thalictri]|uniref:four-carbon acid sugar kinase family protein n=1 Tax=Paenibacillus thalictri TaxID=2527873 RepID=UPI0013EF4C5E|nr:four-carbon acid sugar kinase family protein [Paenibacillus thalictri]
MKIAIVSDDLTGANDTGVQLAKRGFSTVVHFGMELALEEIEACDVHVFDTDSRALEPAAAYGKVYELANALQSGPPFDIVYKKIDSTLRGNLGAELDAMYDAFRPDFAVIAPSFPKNGRCIIGGILFIDGVPVSQTEVAKDPKTPVTESFLPRLLGAQTAKRVGHVTLEQLRHKETLADRLEQFIQDETPYVVFDSESEGDLELIAQAMSASAYSAIWVGSAGLAFHLAGGTEIGGFADESQGDESDYNEQVLLVVGSVSGKSRGQLEQALARTDTAGVELEASRVAGDDSERAEEITRVLALVEAAAASKCHVALYSSGRREQIAEAVAAGRRFNRDERAVSQLVADTLGEIAARAARSGGIKRLVLTGGDTAKQVLLRLGCERLELLAEVEPGIPLGRSAAADGQALYAVTKAGSFGSATALSDAMDLLLKIK